jgi:hypothetical protein
MHIHHAYQGRNPANENPSLSGSAKVDDHAQIHEAEDASVFNVCQSFTMTQWRHRRAVGIIRPTAIVIV